ncbi:MAG: ribosome small subunit-dependent GTPase A [Pseudomonadota bacterium]
MSHQFCLADLGWRPFFQQQLSLQEWEHTSPARVVEQHRSILEVETENGAASVPILSSSTVATVGDWVLLAPEGKVLRVLERNSCFRRRAAGRESVQQLLAANVDTAFIVCAMNADFNLNRIERYLSMVNEAGAESVVVLSKSDLCIECDRFKDRVQRLDGLLQIVSVNCLSAASAEVLQPWCGRGDTVVLLGSSGAGKSTQFNTLTGTHSQLTGTVRESDAKGRHTTTRRTLAKIPGGGMIIDTPGMRELQISDCELGVSATFADIEELARGCRFADCQHDTEPDCAVKKAIEAGELDERRLLSYRKLQREQAKNSASAAELRAKDKKRGRYYKTIARQARGTKQGGR